MSNTQKIQKKDDSKKVEEKTQPKKPQVFSAYVSEITPINQMRYVIQNEKQPKRQNLSLAFVDVPRYDKVNMKEECFAYECGEFLRKKLITGKLIKFETVLDTMGEMKGVIPFVGKENLIVSLLEKGYVVLKSNVKAPAIYTAAETKAKEAKVGVHSDNVMEICTKRPEKVAMNEVEAQAIVGKTVVGHIKKIEAPAVYTIENEERKQFQIHLYAVDQMLRRDNAAKKWVFDEDGNDAMTHCTKYFYKRDVTVEVKQALNGRLYGVIRQDKKDIAEDLLKNGFVVCRRFEGIPESIKQPYEKAEKEAKKEKRARWSEFDQALEDKIIAEREERIRKLEERKTKCNVISGAEVKKINKFIEVVKEGKTYNINLASVRIINKKNDKKFNDLVMFRVKECIRKQIVGRKFECKEAYREKMTINEKEVEHVFYDVYAAGKNISINLLKEGLVKLVIERDQFKRSFDYDKFLEINKQNIRYQPKEVKFVEKEDKIKNKDVYLKSAPSCVLEKVVSPVKFLIYIPEKDQRMMIALKGCRIPRDDENQELQQFLKSGRQFIRQNVGMQEVTVSFDSLEKGEFLCDVTCKKFDFATQLIKNGYVMFVGKDAPSEEAELMRETSDKIWKFQPARKPREEREPRPVAPKPKREAPKEIKFGEGKKIYITGYNGNEIFYYDNAEDAKYIEELSNQMKALKRSKIEDKEGSLVIVEVKGKFYRAQIVDPVPKAFIVKCIDTGAIVVCGKNRLKPMTSEFREFVAPKQVQSVALVGIKTPVRGKHEEYEISIASVAEYYNKEATLYTTTFGETVLGKVIVEDVCINTMLVAEGLAVLNKNFKDVSEWGVAMTTAQEAAREKHNNMWKYGEFFDDEDRDQK